MHDVIYLLITALVGLVLSFLLVSVFSVGESGDDSLNRDVQQMVMQSFIHCEDMVLIPLVGVWNIGVDIAALATTRVKWTLTMTFLTVAALLMHYYHADILSIVDDGWKCVFVPLMDNILEPFLQITRVFYGLSIPIVNGLLIMHAQVLKAWYVTLTACNHISVFKMFEQLVLAMMTGTSSFVKWFHDSEKTNPVENTFYYNDFVIERPVNHTLTALSVGQEVVACACKRFEPLFNIGFIITQEPHVTAAIDNLFQFGIRVFQMLFRILLSEFPDIYKVTFKLERGLTELGLAADSIMFKTLVNIIRMFDSDFREVKDASLRYPNEGLFTAAMHAASGAVHVGATLGVNGPLHMMASFDPNRSPLAPHIWNIEPAVAKMYQSVNSISTLLQWLVYVFEQMITQKQPLSTVFSDAESPLSLNCNWARDVDDHRYVKLSYTVGCTAFNFGISGVNTLAIVSGLTSELLLKSIFTQKQNVFRTMQRWEGPTIPRKKVYSCEDRKAATAYDYTKKEYDPSGWIWTQDKHECQCDIHYGTTLDEDQPAFNPWCGQPSLNFDLFAPLDALVMHVSHGVLGPGFGDAFPFIKPLRSIDINIESIGMEKSIVLPLALPPITRTAIESARVMTRVVLSFGDIVTGHFFNYPVNCGHGLNKEQLEARYKVHYPEEPVPTEDEELRWRQCKAKQYSAFNPTQLFWKKEDQRRIELCDTNNDQNSCMCSYLQPLEPTSACRCIAKYPDLDVTASSQQVGDLIEDRFTSEDVSMHWCNSMIIEWTFQNTGAFADALDYIVSLGPINPGCDVIDRILQAGEQSDQCKAVADANDAVQSGTAGSSSAGAAAAVGNTAETACNLGAGLGSITFGGTDRRAQSTFEISTTPTLSFLGEFMASDQKLNHISDLYSNRPTGCAIVTNDYGQREWACDVSGDATRLTELDEAVDIEDAGCTIYGRRDFFCSAGLYVRNQKRVSMNIARQVVNNGISIIAGNYIDVNLKTLPRLCDYERQQGALAAMVGGLIPGISKTIQVALTKFVNYIFQLVSIHGTRDALTIIQMATTILEKYMGNDLDEDTLGKTVYSAAKTLIKNQIYIIKSFFEVTGDMLRAIAPGSEKICTDIVRVMNIIEERFEEGLLDLLALVAKTSLQAVAIVTGDSSQMQEFIDGFLELMKEMLDLLVSQAFVILDEFLKFFKEVGTFIRVFLSVGCQMLNMVMLTIDTIMRMVPGGQGIGWDADKMKCPQLPFLTSQQGHEGSGRSHLYFKQHFLQSDDEDILKRVAESIDWNGTALCDNFMLAVSEHSYSELRPLERVQWYECLELKLIGVEIAGFLDAPRFPTDIMYNWKRKYILMYDGLRAVKIALPFFLKKTPDWSGLRMALNEGGLDADMHIRIFQSISTQFSKFVNNAEAANVLATLLGHFDPEYDNAENPSNSARVWRVFGNAKSMYNDATSEWTEREMTKSVWKVKDAATDAHTHLHRWWNALGTENQQHESHTEKIFSVLKSRWKRSMSEPTRKSPHHTDIHWLGIPIKTKPQTCSQRGSPVWCTECSIVDNIIDQAFEHAEGMSNFYSYSFPAIMTDVSTYFGSAGQQGNSEFFDKHYSKLSSTAPEEVVPTTGVRWTTHVANDWKYLATNFTEYVTNSSHKQPWLNQVDKFIASSRKLMTYTDSTYVPFFGYSLYHVYDYILFSSCDVDNSIFIPFVSQTDSDAKQQQRLENIDVALITCLIVATIIVTNTVWSFIPLVWLANTVVLGFILGFIYLHVVYSWQLSCSPLLPYPLVEDMYAWYDSRLQTGCFYKLLPYMAVSPSEDMCKTCSAPTPWQSEQIRINDAWSTLNQTTWNATSRESEFTKLNQPYYEVQLGQRQTYIDCSSYRVTESTIHLGELINEWSIFWTPLFWLRWQFPGLGAFFIENGIFEVDSVIGKLALSAWQNEAVDDVWIDCYHAMWLNNVISLAAAGIVAYAAAKLAIVVFQTILQAIVLVWYVYTTLGYITLAVEKSVVVEE